MTERPMLFNNPMVRAILDGSKTQTRRAVKGVPLEWLGNGFSPEYVALPENNLSPYGQVGDQLWVRENGWEPPNRTAKMMREGADTWADYYYDADGFTDIEHEQFKQWGFKRRPSIHMPRWASRIQFEITGVRIERLQDISEADALEEGITYNMIPNNGLDPMRARTWFRGLWESINGPGSWEANPWVWVVEFRRVKP